MEVTFLSASDRWVVTWHVCNQSVVNGRYSITAVLVILLENTSRTTSITVNVVKPKVRHVKNYEHFAQVNTNYWKCLKQLPRKGKIISYNFVSSSFNYHEFRLKFKFRNFLHVCHGCSKYKYEYCTGGKSGVCAFTNVKCLLRKTIKRCLRHQQFYLIVCVCVCV